MWLAFIVAPACRITAPPCAPSCAQDSHSPLRTVVTNKIKVGETAGAKGSFYMRCTVLKRHINEAHSCARASAQHCSGLLLTIEHSIDQAQRCTARHQNPSLCAPFDHCSSSIKDHSLAAVNCKCLCQIMDLQAETPCWALGVEGCTRTWKRTCEHGLQTGMHRWSSCCLVRRLQADLNNNTLMCNLLYGLINAAHKGAEV